MKIKKLSAKKPIFWMIISAAYILAPKVIYAALVTGEQACGM